MPAHRCLSGLSVERHICPRADSSRCYFSVLLAEPLKPRSTWPLSAAWPLTFVLHQSFNSRTLPERPRKRQHVKSHGRPVWLLKQYHKRMNLYTTCLSLIVLQARKAEVKLPADSLPDKWLFSGPRMTPRHVLTHQKEGPIKYSGVSSLRAWFPFQSVLQSQAYHLLKSKYYTQGICFYCVALVWEGENIESTAHSNIVFFLSVDTAPRRLYFCPLKGHKPADQGFFPSHCNDFTHACLSLSSLRIVFVLVQGGR